MKPKMTNPENILVLCGGNSTERDVSLTSGALVAKALVEEGFKVLLWDLSCDADHLPADLHTLFTNVAGEVPHIGTDAPDAALREQLPNVGKNVPVLCQAADVVFLALHGGMGENGQVQAMLDTLGVVYTGSGHLGSAIAMDKDIAKRILQAANLPTPVWRYGSAAELTSQFNELKKTFANPPVLKQTCGGSSVGVWLPATWEEAQSILSAAAPTDEMMAEARIIGRELTVGVLDGKALPAIEIRPKTGFYDYKNKYQAGLTEEICPAPLDAETAHCAAELAESAFRAMRLSCYARFDMMLDAQGQLWILEANTLPGMTPTSLLPQAAAATGLSYGKLCRKIIELAIKK